MKKTNITISPEQSRRTDLSIIIVSFNTKNLLRDCLDSIFKNLIQVALNYEVIVVDNNSTDGSREMLKSEYWQVKLIYNTENLGFGRGNNQGAKMAKGQTLLFLNSDIVALDAAISKLYAFFQSLQSESIVGAKLLNPDKTPQPSCGPEYSLLNIFIALFLKGDYLRITRYSPERVKQVDWVMGACIMMAKSSFKSLGGFDEGIFMYMEEIDLQLRAKKQNMSILFYPEAQFIHAGHASSGGRANPILNVFRGFLYYYKKHGSAVQNSILRILLLLKSVSAIFLFSLLGKKYDRDIYIGALKLLN